MASTNFTVYPVEDSLTSTSTTNALSAAQGKALNGTKAPIDNPNFTGSISLGRIADTTVGAGSVAEGASVTASGSNSHAEGIGTTASGQSSHAEGGSTFASGSNSHAEGGGTIASGNSSHSEGVSTTASGSYSHAEGASTTASKNYSHAEGSGTTASGNSSHAEGGGTIASGNYSHAEGRDTKANGDQSHAEGAGTTASWNQSHAEGDSTTASGHGSHAEGLSTCASGQGSHAEGNNTIAAGSKSHVSGEYNVEDSYANWPEWTANTSYEVGDKVKVTTGNGSSQTTQGYICKTANSDSTFTSSKWTSQYGKMNYAEIIGNGTTDARSNARALDWEGNGHYAGDLYVHCNADSTGGNKVATTTDLANKLDKPSNIPAGKYLQTDSNGDAVWGDSITVENNLTSTSTTNALSAAQGKVLNDSKVNISDIVDVLDNTSTNKPLSAAKGKALNDNISSLSNAIGTVPSGQTVEGQISSLSAKIGSVGTTDLQTQVSALGSKLDNLSADVIASNAGAHNGIYRGKYLGSSVTSEQYAAISNGTFDDLYIGDYWTIGGHDWVICDFDYYIRCGSVDVNRHHLVMMPSGGMKIPAGTALYGASGTLTLLDSEVTTSKKWNATSEAPSTDSTAGGYKYSRMRTVIMKAANTIVINAFGSEHVLPFAELYYSPERATDSGLASGWGWFPRDDQSSATSKSICDLCNETMVYGQQVWGLGSAYGNVGFEIGIDKFQLAIFALHRGFANIRASWWLRSVSSATAASFVNIDGSVYHGGSSDIRAIRPRFLLVG